MCEDLSQHLEVCWLAAVLKSTSSSERAMHLTENAKNDFQWILEAGVIALFAPQAIAVLIFTPTFFPHIFGPLYVLMICLWRTKVNIWSCTTVKMYCRHASNELLAWAQNHRNKLR